MRTVIAIVVKNGEVLSYATNEHTERCKREGHETGQGYELCKGCDYPNHAEYKACQKDGLEGAKFYLFGHTYACDPCQEAMKKSGIYLYETIT